MVDCQPRLAAGLAGLGWRMVPMLTAMSASAARALFSANLPTPITHRGDLAETSSRETGRPAFHIETEADLDLAALRKFNTLGITAGASTPPWVTDKVCGVLQNLT